MQGKGGLGHWSQSFTDWFCLKQTAHIAEASPEYPKIPRAHLSGAWNAPHEGDPDQHGGDCDARGRV
jgi:hypothetical protein